MKKKNKKQVISIDQAVIWCAAQIEARGETITFEKIIAECFYKFPEIVALNGYPQWPDSKKINSSWHRCRTDRGWLIGNVRRHFKLTSLGRIMARNVGIQLGIDVQTQVPFDDCERLIKKIRNSSAFKNYQKKAQVSLTNKSGTRFEQLLKLLAYYSVKS